MSRHQSSSPCPPPFSHRRVRGVHLLLAAAMVALCTPQAGLASQTFGGQFQVNVFTGSSQYLPAVATNAAGDFILAWESWGSPGNVDFSGTAIEGSVAIGNEFRVNTSTLNKQAAPAVAINASGNSVVVWQSAHADINNPLIMAQRYDINGNKVGSELTVSGGGNNVAPAVAMANNGDFVVVWESNAGVGGDTDKSIQGRRFRASTGSFMNQFLVNNVTPSDQRRPAIASDGDVTYLVAFETSAASADIAIRYFTATGSSGSGMSANANQETANTYTASAQNSPAVAMTPDGRALVAWESFSSAGPDPVASIQARRLDAAGSFLDPSDVEVNQYTTSTQRTPAVAVDANAIFSVIWASFGSFGTDDTISYSVQLRSVTASGHWEDPLDVQVNAHTPGYQDYPAAAFLPEGYLFVVWQSNGTPPGESDTDGYSIQGTLVDVFLFADGFESGDTSRWTETTL